MSNKNAWECDICHTVFMEDKDSHYDDRCTITIIIPEGKYTTDESHKWEDICVSCRRELVAAIDDLLDRL